MSLQAQFILLAWLPFVIYLFAQFPTVKAVVISFVVAWLFLPEGAGFSVEGLPDYTKWSAACYGALIATAIFDTQRFGSFRFGWLDIPMLVWCLCPYASSISNGMDSYDALSQVFNQTVHYGIPYFLGRIYLSNLASLRQLALGILTGGLIYVPLCLFEVRMSPQLHRLVYGYDTIMFAKNLRLGGFRPTVFMGHGLTVGMWMMAATLIGIWLWRAKVVKEFWGIPAAWLVSGLLVTFVLVKSTGAYIYFAYGLFILLAARWLGSAIPLLLLIAAISFYLFLGASGNFSSQQADHVVSIATQIAGQERAESLEFRLDNEEILSEKARQRILLGWGGWGRNRVYEENWEGDLVDITITDSLWILAFGNYGLVGLVSVFGSSLLPAFAFWRRYPASQWFEPKVASAAVLSVVITLYMVDCSLNNKPNPVFTLASGGIAGLILHKRVTNHRSKEYDPVAKVVLRRKKLSVKLDSSQSDRSLKP